MRKQLDVDLIGKFIIMLEQKWTNEHSYNSVTVPVELNIYKPKWGEIDIRIGKTDYDELGLYYIKYIDDNCIMKVDEIIENVESIYEDKTRTERKTLKYIINTLWKDYIVNKYF